MSWESLLVTLGIGGLSVCATVIIAFLRKKASRLFDKIDDPIIGRLNDKLNTLIDDSIHTVNKRFVDKLKETDSWDKLDGVFDKDTYKKNASEALDLCLASLKSRIPKSLKAIVSKHYDHLDTFYKEQIDRRLKEHELATKAVCCDNAPTVDPSLSYTEVLATSL